MPRLISRQKFIPNGFQFYDANLKWSAPRGASFQVICDGLRSARMANPGITSSKNLNTDPNAIAEEVDAFNAAICQQHGWNDFITGGSGGAAVPFQQQFHNQFRRQPRPPQASPLQKLANVAAGSEVLVEWIASGAEAVPQEQASRRAAVCAKCPLNEKGGWETWFTVPVSSAIKKALNKKGDFKLATPFDAELGVCSACSCPMSLKVWVPFEKFYGKMADESRDALHLDCWIRAEAPE